VEKTGNIQNQRSADNLPTMKRNGQRCG